MNEYFHPDLPSYRQMLSDIAFELAHVGKQVTVMTNQKIVCEPKSHTGCTRDFDMLISGYDLLEKLARTRRLRFGKSQDDLYYGICQRTPSQER